MDAPPFPAAAVAAAREAIKVQLRSAGADADAVIEQVATSAMALAEAFTGRALIVRDWTEIVPVACGWRRLPVTPVLSITMVEGLPAEGAAFALPVGDYAVDIDADGAGWVRVMNPGIAGRARVTFSAGIAEAWAGLPAPIAQGVAVLGAHQINDRSAGTVPPAAVTALWRPWRMLHLRAGERR